MNAAGDFPLSNLRSRSSSASSHGTLTSSTLASSRQSFSQLEPLAASSTRSHHVHYFNSSSGTLGRLRYYEALLDRKLGLETAGPQRILPEDRHGPKPRMMALIWTGATLNLGCFASGLLGWELGLTFAETFWTTCIGTVLGSAVTGWCAILGPPTGLRQVSISRYSLGWNTARVVALLNIVTTLGFSAVSCIAAGLALTSLSNNILSPSFGITLTCFNATFFSFFGLRGVIWYQKYAWIICVSIFVVVYLEAIPQADITTPPSAGTWSGGLEPVDRRSALLGLLSISYGQCGGWASIVSDFYVQYPSKTPTSHVFLLTTFGLGLSNLAAMTAGALVASTMSSNTVWLNAYLSPGSVGALLHTVVQPPFFATIVLVLFVLSGTGANCMGIYTGALSLQQFSPRLQAIPRFLWTLVFFVVILLIAIPGQTYLLPLLQNLLATLGYWNTAFFVVLFTEHHLFRRGTVGSYDLDAWDDRTRLPVGWAGGAAFAAGVLASLAGMDESWWTGPIARWVGGDVGNLLAAAVTVAVFVPVRMWEKRTIGR